MKMKKVANKRERGTVEGGSGQSIVFFLGSYPHRLSCDGKKMSSRNYQSNHYSSVWLCHSWVMNKRQIAIVFYQMQGRLLYRICSQWTKHTTYCSRNTFGVSVCLELSAVILCIPKQNSRSQSVDKFHRSPTHLYTPYVT